MGTVRWVFNSDNCLVKENGMNRWTRRLLMAASLVSFASMGVGCADEREPINRVQANALDKAFFVGNMTDELDNPVFFSKAFIIDQTAGQNGLSVGLYSGTDRIKWEVAEEWLIAHKAYQIAQGQDEKGKPEGAPNGVVVAKFAITGHFDIKRSYNPQTGEELNVVEENTSDRPWYERQYMRVDWSSNAVVDPMWGEIFFGKIFGDLNVEPLTYTVTDPQSEDAPYFDVKDGYFDVTNKYYTTPRDEYFAPWGVTLPSCALVGIFTSSTTRDCNNQEATVRHSFWKVDPNNDFEPTENTKRKMDVVASFGGAGDSFQPGFAGGTTQCWDPQYAYTDACFNQYLVKTNFWAKSHVDVPCTSDMDADDNGTADECATASSIGGSQCDLFFNKCTIPLRERAIKPVGFWMNKETPADLLDAVNEDGSPVGTLDVNGQPTIRGPMEDVIHTWNQATMTALAYGREVECRRTNTADRATCHNTYFQVDGAGNDVLQMLSFGGWGIATPTVQPQDGPYALTSCHAPVRAYDLHDTCGPTGEVARNGDQRKNFIYYWPYDSNARYGGVAGLGQDPETGESHGMTATVMGRSATRAAANYRDYIQYALGDFTQSDFEEGVPQFLFQKISQNGYSPQSQMAKQEAGVPLEQPMPEQKSSSSGQGGIQAKDAVFKPSLSNFLKDQQKMAYHPLLQTTTQPIWEALADRVRGTDWEAKVVGQDWAMQTTGADPLTMKDGVKGDLLEAASPFRALDPGRMALWRSQIEAKLAAKGICFVEDVPRVGSINWAGISRWYLDKFEDMGLTADMAPGSPRDPNLVKQRGDFIYKDLFKGMARGIAIHEVGHCLGMRHNFASSYDAPNFMPQYWQLRSNEGQTMDQCQPNTARDPNDPDVCLGRRFEDPETEDEQGLSPRDAQGRSQGRPGIAYFGNTSVMEYEQDYLSPGFGTYDMAYLKAVYAGVLETYDIDREPQGGIAEPDQDQFSANIGLQLSELNILGPNVAHYTDLSNELRVFRPEYCREATPEEVQQGEWRVVHGKICGQSPRDHFRWKDFIDDNDDGAEMPFAWLNLTAWKTRRASTGDNRVRNRWNYRYGETYGHGYLHTNPSDNGADVYEVVIGNQKMFDLTYPISYFRRQNKEYMYKTLPWSTADRYFERARSFHWILEDRAFGSEFEKARVETFHFLARSALLPEPGGMKAFSQNGETVYDADPDNIIQFPATFQVAQIDGRYISDEFSNVNGGNWDYLSWINHAAYNAERGMAIRALFDGRPTLYTISRDTALDGRNVLRNFRDDQADGVDRLLGGLLSEDWGSVAMWIGNTDIPDPNGGLPYRSVQMFDLTAAAPSRPAGSAAVFPNIGFRQQVWMIINANLYGNMNSDQTLLNKMAIYIEGIDLVAALPDAELVKFVNPFSGFTYVARLFGPQTINGKTVDKGIASRMLQHANDLKAANDPELEKYIGLLDTARGVSQVYKSTAIPDMD
jgi:hypothetical protein